MKIKITQEIDVPDDFSCRFNPMCLCEGILDQEEGPYCDIYGERLHGGDKGPVKCQQCVDATYKAMKGE